MNAKHDGYRARGYLIERGFISAGAIRRLKRRIADALEVGSLGDVQFDDARADGAKPDGAGTIPQGIGAVPAPPRRVGRVRGRAASCVCCRRSCSLPPIGTAMIRPVRIASSPSSRVTPILEAIIASTV